MSTDVIVSPVSTSAKPQSLAVVVNVCVASSATVAAPPVVVGASFTAFMFIVVLYLAALYAFAFFACQQR